MVTWQQVLERHADLFAEVQPGASIALAPGSPPRANVKQVREAVPMQLWLRGPERMAVVAGEYRGLKSLAADALLLPEEGALDAALAHAEPLSELKRQLRDGRMLVMVMRSRKELRELGWSDFFEALGLPFQGSCR
ncbi:MAG: hypothetical protein EPO29_01565 [Betaproteobacteria bacterium]|nr:MAG: hypothetical protein EPO29_01565 [Betaproteobacteria bacterium]